jgi:hemolysin III
MSTSPLAKVYSPFEEAINVYSHIFGIVLSIIGLVALVIHANADGNVWHIVSFSIFGFSLILLYTASSVYHHAKDPVIRGRLRVFDHASIYVLIAGTYTPFTLITLSGTVGWVIFGVAWSMALTGIILKLFFTGRFKIISTSMYIFMGWMVVFAINPLIENLPSTGLYLLVAGGLAYTIGAVLYSIKAIPLNHAMFHILILVGSFCHFLSVYFYVLPI